MNMIARAPLLVLASLLAACASMSPGQSAAPRVVMEEFMVPAADPGIELYVRNKHPEGMTSVGGSKIVLYVHGATYPSETAFDLQLNGFSWMDYIARHGYDVYLVDVRGYGRSTRPKEMSEPAERSEPIVRTPVAAQDVAAAVEFIRKRRGADQVNLLGWSWGTSINDKVNKLVLYAPQWLRTTASLVTAGGKPGDRKSVV